MLQEERLHKRPSLASKWREELVVVGLFFRRQPELDLTIIVLKFVFPIHRLTINRNSDIVKIKKAYFCENV